MGGVLCVVRTGGVESKTERRLDHVDAKGPSLVWECLANTLWGQPSFLSVVKQQRGTSQARFTSHSAP